MPIINIDREEPLGIRIEPDETIPVRVDNSVQVKVNDPPLRVNIHDPTKQVFEFKLNVRRALNGDLMIFDHNDIDIMILTEKKKIVAFAKDMMSDIVYGAENRLFTHLRRQGVIAYDSIQGGNVYGSMEGLMLEMKGDKQPETVDYVLYQISEWMNTERPYFESSEAYDNMLDDHLLDPDDEFSTELGEVPHEEEKGGILQRGMFSPYYYGRYTY
tara:strand:+ start:10708 stop:11352 length:645 start_codon:yes stop_codon:yes gene_type:complete